jgi:Ca-activated chloride channel homolog
MIALAAIALAAAGCAAAPRPKPEPAEVAAAPAVSELAVVQVVDPQLIDLIAEPTADRILAERPGRLAVRLRISARDLAGAARPPLNLAVAIDTSGSMEGEAIVAAREAATGILERLADGDRLAIVVFHSSAEVLVPSTRIDAAARQTIRTRIAAMQARGTTDLASGLSLALQQVAIGVSVGSLNRLVLLSDGVPNDPGLLPALAQQAQQAQVPIAALGLGVDFDETLLAALAMQTGGAYRYVDRAEAVAEVFDGEVLRLQRLVGRNLEVVVRPGPGVTIDAIPGFVATGDGRALVARIGDLSAGEIRDLIVPVTVEGRRDRATVELLDAVLRFEDVIGGSGVRQRDAYAAVHADADARAVKASVHLEVDLAVARAMAAGSILQAVAMARSGQVELARQQLAEAQRAARAAAARYQDPELEALAAQMKKLEGSLAAMAAQVEPTAPTLQQNEGPARGVDVYVVPGVAPPATSMGPASVVLKEAHGVATEALRGSGRTQ